MAEISGRSMICPACREPLTGPGRKGPVELPPEPEISAPPPVQRAGGAGPASARAKAAASDLPWTAGQDAIESTAPEPGNPAGAGKWGGAGLPGQLGRLESNSPPSPPSAFPREKSSPVEWIIQRIQQEFVSPDGGPLSQKQKMKIAAAAIVLSLGVILFFRLIIVRPWSLKGESAPPAESLEKEFILSAGSAQSPVASPGSPVGGAAMGSPGGAPVEAGGVAAKAGGASDKAAGAAEKAGPPSQSDHSATNLSDKKLLAAAEQIERLAAFLASGANPQATPVNPSKREDILPPLNPDDFKGRSKVEVIKSRRLLPDLIMERLLQARGAGLTSERARAAASRLREKVEQRRAKANSKGEGAGAGKGADLPAPQAGGAAMSDAEFREAMALLLGNDTTEEVMRDFKQ